MNPQLLIAYPDDFPVDGIQAFLQEIAAENLEIVSEAQPKRGPFAGIEWLLPTAVIVVVTKSYFDGFLKEMGKDHYQVLKIALSNFLKRVGEIKFAVFSSKGKSLKDNPYSPLFSVLAEAGFRQRFKLLVQNNLSDDDALQVIEAFLDFLSAYHANSVDAELARQLGSATAVGGTYLLAFDLQDRKIKVIDPIPRRPSVVRDASSADS